eukprot:g4380.t1
MAIKMRDDDLSQSLRSLRLDSPVSTSPSSRPSTESTLIIYPRDCLEHDTGDEHQEHPNRLRVLCEESSNGILRGEKLHWLEGDKVQPCELSDVLRVHEYSYVRNLQSVVNSCPNSSLTKLDSDTRISKGSFRAALLAAGSVCTAVDAIAFGLHKNAFCAVRPPGHHAGPRGAVPGDNFHDNPGDCSCGFCLLNSVAIGAAYARHHYGRRKMKVKNAGAQLERIAILDFDIHHGNGTEAIIRNLVPHREILPLPQSYAPVQVESYKPWLNSKDSEEVWFGSIHLCYPGFYPGSGSGQATPKIPIDKLSSYGEIFSDENVVNIGLKCIGPIDVYKRSRVSANQKKVFCKQASTEFRERLKNDLFPKLEKFNPDLIFLSAGFDGHCDDFYYWLTEEDYSWMTQQVINIANRTSAAGRVISVLEGGYSVRNRDVPKQTVSSSRPVRKKKLTPKGEAYSSKISTPSPKKIMEDRENEIGGEGAEARVDMKGRPSALASSVLEHIRILID